MFEPTRWLRALTAARTADVLYDSATTDDSLLGGWRNSLPMLLIRALLCPIACYEYTGGSRSLLVTSYTEGLDPIGYLNRMRIVFRLVQV